MEVFLACTVRVPGIEEGADDRQAVRWSSQEEGLDPAVIECFHNSWEEVSHGGGGNDTQDV